jgi:hypothetical protein
MQYIDIVAPFGSKPVTCKFDVVLISNMYERFFPDSEATDYLDPGKGN